MKHMSSEPPAFVGSVPKDYDAYLGPFLFDFYAADLAARMGVDPGSRILETACGTGIATEVLRNVLPSGCEIVATDLSEAMLDHARSTRGHLEGVRFDTADAADLPFGDGFFDAVCSQFGLMFIPDKLQAMREVHRVLRPGGQFTFNVWGDLASNPYVQVAQSVIESFFESDPPTFLYLPWSYSDPKQIDALLTDAGFSEVNLRLVPHIWRGSTSEGIARGLVCGNPTIAHVLERATASVDEVVSAVANALDEAFGGSNLRVPMQAVVVTART